MKLTIARLLTLHTARARRHDLVDCERESTSVKIKEHRRNELRGPSESSIEFKVLAKFQNNLDDTNGEHDTYYLTVDTMLDNGFQPGDIKARVKDFYKRSYEAACQAINAYEPASIDDEQ